MNESELLGLIRVGIVIFLIFSGGVITGIMMMDGAFMIDERWIAGNVIWVMLIVDAILLITFFAAGSQMRPVKKTAK